MCLDTARLLKSTILKEHVLLQHAGWYERSQMHLNIYTILEMKVQKACLKHMDNSKGSAASRCTKAKAMF